MTDWHIFSGDEVWSHQSVTVLDIYSVVKDVLTVVCCTSQECGTINLFISALLRSIYLQTNDSNQEKLDVATTF